MLSMSRANAADTHFRECLSGCCQFAVGYRYSLVKMDEASMRHWRCTLRSAAVAIIPDGANVCDGTGSSSDSGNPTPRIALINMVIAATNTITTTAAKRRTVFLG